MAGVGKIRRTLRTDPSVLSAEGNTENTNREVDRLMRLLARRQTEVGFYRDRPDAADRDAGATYHCLDGSTFVHDGSLWRPLNAGILGTQPPPAATWIAGGLIKAPTTFADNAGGILIAGTLGAGTANREGYHIALSASTTTGIVEVGFALNNESTNGGAQDVGFGILLYESATGKVMGAEYLVTISATTVLCKTRAGYGTDLDGPGWGTTLAAPVFDRVGPYLYLKLQFIGGSIWPVVSSNRQIWGAISSVAMTTAFTTAPNRVGIYTISGSSAYAPKALCFHFQQGEPADFPPVM